MASELLTLEYRVSSINEGQIADSINVILVQQSASPQGVPYMAPPPGGPGTVSVSVPTSRSAEFFPGSVFVLTFTPKK